MTLFSLKMQILPSEILVIILKHRRLISWQYFLNKIQSKLNKCLPPSFTHSYTFQRMESVFYTTRNLEILIEINRDNYSFQYVLTTIGNNPQKHLLFTRFVYCPRFIKL